MNLPNVNLAIIAEEKITEYLLNAEHPEGRGKARFFGSLGFSVEQWQTFADALRQLATSFPVTTNVASRHGSKYIVDGTITSPRGISVAIRTV